jgi:hypothetical protein
MQAICWAQATKVTSARLGHEFRLRGRALSINPEIQARSPGMAIASLIRLMQHQLLHTIPAFLTCLEC